MAMSYPFPIANSLAFAPEHSTSDDPSDQPKRHAACDECRQRKLRCSGGPSGCSRCVKLSIFCHYSIQKQMGRPRKVQRRTEDNNNDAAVPAGLDASNATTQDAWDLIPNPESIWEAHNLCPTIYKTFMKKNYEIPGGPFVTNGPIYEAGAPLQPAQPKWVPRWPDYSQINTPMLLQSPLDPAGGPDSSGSTVPSHAPMQLASCSCLAHLYLCLSSISTSSSFPLSIHTITTLYSAARTAKGVIHCQICPQAFSTSMQNLMLLGTLLSVLADNWYCISQQDDLEALGTECVDPSYLATVPTEPELRSEHWKSWLRDVVKHAVVGSTVTPAVHVVQAQCRDTPSLVSLIEEMEDRQRKRHLDNREGSNETKNGFPSCPPPQENEEGDYFCLRVVDTARKVIARFGFEAEKQPSERL